MTNRVVPFDGAAVVCFAERVVTRDAAESTGRPEVAVVVVVVIIVVIRRPALDSGLHCSLGVVNRSKRSTAAPPLASVVIFVAAAADGDIVFSVTALRSALPTLATMFAADVVDVVVIVVVFVVVVLPSAATLSVHVDSATGTDDVEGEDLCMRAV